LTLEPFQGPYYVQVPPDSLPKPLRAGELARLSGVSTDTLRHYERIGVLAHPRRSAAGYRQYSAAAVARVRLIRRALALGFSLAELSRILRVRDRGGAPCREVRALAAAKLEQVETRLADLADLRDQLRELLTDWDRRIEATPEGVPARLLEVELPALLSQPSKKGETR
jgi:DNA-binding transcriptional MerR regulator